MRGFAVALSTLLLVPTIASAAPAPPLVETSKAPELHVDSITKVVRPSSKKASDRRIVSLGDSIVLRTLPDLGKYLDYAAEKGKTVTLFLDGSDTGIAPEAVDRRAHILRFHLERNGDNKKIWSALLRDPFNYHQRDVTASVGLAGDPATVGGKQFTLGVVNKAWYVYFWLILMIGLLLIFVWLVAKRDLLRDGPKPSPYSLGRSQMAWWFFLIIFGYVLIWLISGDQDTITPSLLALMGISAATALGSVVIESTSGGSAGLSRAATDRLAFQAAQENAQQRVAAAQSAVDAAPADPVLQKQLDDAQAALAVASGKLLEVNDRINGITATAQTRNFLRDILSDSNGTVGLHRFQIVVWTIVLGIIFLVSVVTELSMPAFSVALLTTMGISAGTYLGFKFPEK